MLYISFGISNNLALVIFFEQYLALVINCVGVEASSFMEFCLFAMVSGETKKSLIFFFCGFWLKRVCKVLFGFLDHHLCMNQIVRHGLFVLLLSMILMNPDYPVAE